MPEMPRTRFDTYWNVEHIQTELNGVKNARGSTTMSEVLAAKADKAATSAAIADVANAGAKNLLKTLRSSGSSQSVTITLNADGTYSLSGTATSSFSRPYTATFADVPAEYIGKTLRLTGGVNDNLRLAVYETQSSGTILYEDSGEGVDITLTAEMLSNPYDIRIACKSGTDCTGMTVKPMLRLADIPGDTFQQYAPTNRELYEMILALQSGTRSMSMRSDPEEQQAEEESR